MALQFATTLRNDRLAAIRDALDAGSTLHLFTGAKPAANADADSGTLLAQMALPNPALANPANGAISKTGTWEDPEANASGDVGHFRIKDSGGAVIIQGTVTAENGGGDMEISDISLVAGQTTAVTGFTITEANL